VNNAEPDKKEQFRRNASSIMYKDYVEEEEISTKRDDLLHKRNLEFLTELFRKKKELCMNILDLNKMLSDLIWEEM